MRRNEMSKVAPLSLLAVAMLLVPARADATTYRSLATSAPSACVYTGPDAPVLKADVCWNRVELRLKGTAPCASGSYPYFVEYGEVIDPTYGLVLAYIPLDDACAAGFCIEAVPSGPVEAEPLCCNPEKDDCTLHIQGQCNDTIVFCEQAATNEDGTIACFD
ncbi:hypothetical protein ACNOYE_28430 [Nannocystaceae bacterium ST9]